MVTVITEKRTVLMETSTVESEPRPVFFPAPHHAACQRCGGFLVDEVCMDLGNSTGELDCLTKRCVQCGDLVDPVILRNRCLH